MREAETGLLQIWYTENASMRGTSRRNIKLLHALMEKLPNNGYFLELEKICHICTEGKEEE